MDINRKAELRSKYIRKFVNTNDSLYKTNILDTPKCINGECYIGFLWEFLYEPVRVDKDYVRCLVNKIDDVYVG